MKFELYLDEIWHRPNKTTQILEKSDFNFFKAFKKWIPGLNFFQKPVSKAGKKQFYILKKWRLTMLLIIILIIYFIKLFQNRDFLQETSTKRLQMEESMILSKNNQVHKIEYRNNF